MHRAFLADQSWHPTCRSVSRGRAMRKTFIPITLVAAFVAAGTVWYAEAGTQHRKPDEPTTGQQPAQPRRPPQATPRDGQKPEPD